ncbi:hypothetical protein SAMN06265365_108175 [Tistlia consotensis]|uniref:Uncharacterized protein n=1 Tax=Tistlia consotensis USBA 355 TaxID=560819 RepID=A0A1Y6BVM0_9PROT|nr:hypothetical protein [Tistlia consotensis]SMF23395.1 hypothetical protein SAMN05428998_1085 [Tistlia consotensis USBA 355]SNR61712.1 hypothetical protein SAMN06265365_108175 [Tistlia consotensis]
MTVFVLDNARNQTDANGAQTDASLVDIVEGYRQIVQAAYVGFPIMCVEVDDVNAWSHIEGFVGRLQSGPNRLEKVRLIFSDTGSWIAWNGSPGIIFSTPLSEHFNGFDWIDTDAAATTEVYKIASDRARINAGGTIGSLGTAPVVGAEMLIEAGDTALTLTHNAAAILCPGEKDLPLAPGDRARVRYLGGSVSEVLEVLPGSRMHSISIPVASILPSPNGGCESLTNDSAASTVATLEFLLFSASTANHAQAQLTLPKSYTGGDILVEALLASNGSGNVKVDVRAEAVGAGESPSGWGDAATTTVAVGATAGAQKSTGRLTVTPAGTPAGGEELFVQVKRDAADGTDTAADKMRLYAIIVTIPVSKESDA